MSSEDIITPSKYWAQQGVADLERRRSFPGRARLGEPAQPVTSCTAASPAKLMQAAPPSDPHPTTPLCPSPSRFFALPHSGINGQLPISRLCPLAVCRPATSVIIGCCSCKLRRTLGLTYCLGLPWTNGPAWRRKATNLTAYSSAPYDTVQGSTTPVPSTREDYGSGTVQCSLSGRGRSSRSTREIVDPRSNGDPTSCDGPCIAANR